MLSIESKTASEAAIAEGGDVVTSTQIDYVQKYFSHPDYRFDPQFPNTFGQTITLGASQTPSTINLPPEVFNMAPAILSYTVTLPAVPNNYIWYSQNSLAEISHLQWFPSNGQFIVDLDNLQNYLDIVLKKEQSREDFLSNSELIGSYASNSVANVIPALRNANVANVSVDNKPTNPSKLNYVVTRLF